MIDHEAACTPQKALAGCKLESALNGHRCRFPATRTWNRDWSGEGLRLFAYAPIGTWKAALLADPRARALHE